MAWSGASTLKIILLNFKGIFHPTNVINTLGGGGGESIFHDNKILIQLFNLLHNVD